MTEFYVINTGKDVKNDYRAKGITADQEKIFSHGNVIGFEQRTPNLDYGFTNRMKIHPGIIEICRCHSRFLDSVQSDGFRSGQKQLV